MGARPIGGGEGMGGRGGRGGREGRGGKGGGKWNDQKRIRMGKGKITKGYKFPRGVAELGIDDGSRGGEGDEDEWDGGDKVVYDEDEDYDEDDDYYDDDEEEEEEGFN